MRPVEQLLELAANQMNGTAANYRADDLEQLVKVIEDSQVFPTEVSCRKPLLGACCRIDFLAASVLTQALQRYGQNERSLFTFLNANEPFSLSDFDPEQQSIFQPGLCL